MGKTKLRARKRAHDMAFELLNMYATRKTVLGFAFNKDDENQINFEKEFSYAETPDQIKVTEEIKKDMESNHPMDRLLCGDVGYGKQKSLLELHLKQFCLVNKLRCYALLLFCLTNIT